MRHTELKKELAKLPPGTQVIIQSWKDPDKPGRLYQFAVVPN